MYATYRPQLWGPYGFTDAFNPSLQWFASEYLGIDQGPIVLMIENARTGRIWHVFMQHAAIQRGLAHAGFAQVTEAKQASPIPDLASPTPLPETQPVHPDLAPPPPPPETPPTPQRS
jgi:hypothetical protein